MSWDGFNLVKEDEELEAPAPGDDWEPIDINANGPSDEEGFRDWYRRWADTIGLDPNPDDPQHYYDYRAAYRAGAEPSIAEDGKYHWPSQFKSDDHPNRYVGGIDTKTGERVMSEEEAGGPGVGWGPGGPPKDAPWKKTDASADQEWEPVPVKAQPSAGQLEQPPDQLEQAPGAGKQLLTEGNLAGAGHEKPAPLTPEQQARAQEKFENQARMNEEAKPYLKILGKGYIPEPMLDNDAVLDLLSGVAQDRAGIMWDKRRKLILEDKDLTPDEIAKLNILGKAMGYNSQAEGFSYALASTGEIVGQILNTIGDDELNPLILGGYASMAAGATAAALSGPLSLVTVPAAMTMAGGAAVAVQQFRRAKAIEGGLAFQELMEDDDGGKWDAKTKAVAADIIGSINGALELVGFEAGLGLIPGLKEVARGGIRPFVKRNKQLREAILNAAKRYVVGVAGETGTEVSQEIAPIVTKAINQDQDILEALKSDETKDQLTEILTKVGSAMMLLGAPGTAVHVAKGVKDANKSAQLLETMLPVYERYADALEGGLETGTVDAGAIQSVLDQAQAQWEDNPIIPRLQEMLQRAGGETAGEAGPSMYTPATDEEISALQANLAKNLPADTEIDVSPADERRGFGVIQRIADATGTRVVFYQATGEADQHNGIYDEDTNTIFINQSSQNPFAVVLGHETLHQMKNEHADLYESLSSALRGKELGFDAFLATLNESRKAQGLKELTLDDALAREEFIADFVGSQFKEKSFWEAVNKKDPTLGQRLANYVYDLVEKIKKALGIVRPEDRQFVSDLEAAQDALATVYTEFARRKTVKDQTVQPVEKTAGQKVVEAVGTILSPAAAEAKTIGPTTTKATKGKPTPQAAGESTPTAEGEWEPVEIKPPDKDQEEFDRLWGQLDDSEKKRLADIPGDQEMTAQEKLGLLKSEIATKAKKPKEAAPEPATPEQPPAEGKAKEEAPSAVQRPEEEADQYKKEMKEYRQKNAGKVFIPDELADAWEFIQGQVQQGAVERSDADGFDHVVASTYPKWFGKSGGKWSRKEFEAIAKKVNNGEKLTELQYYRFLELLDVMIGVRDSDPEMAALYDQKEKISSLEDEGFEVHMTDMVAGDIPEGAELQIDGKRYVSSGWTDDGFVLLKGKEDLKLEPFDSVFVEGIKGGKVAEPGESELIASLKRRDFDIEVAAADAEGNIGRATEKASVALEENRKQLDFARRLLECLNS